jgi:hypothetical protein
MEKKDFEIKSFNETIAIFMYVSTFQTKIPAIFQYREDFNNCALMTQIWRSIKRHPVEQLT